MGNGDISLAEQLAETARGLQESALQLLPGLAGALALLLVGWILARILELLTQRLLGWVESGLGALIGRGRAERLRLSRSSRALGTVVFWVVLLVFVAAAGNILGLELFTQWLDRLLEYLPSLLAGLLIIGIGYVLAGLVAELILGSAARLPPAQRAVLARAAQVTIVVGALLVGADQIGLRVTFLAIFAGAAAFAIAGGVIVAISLGAREHVANLIGAHYLRQQYEIGQLIRVAGFEGRIVDIGTQVIVLETEDGRVALPAAIYGREPVALITRRSDG